VKGATLTVEAGSEIVFAQALSTKTEPQHWNPGTELAVEGTLRVLGTAEAPVTFAPQESSWGGLIAAPGSLVQLSGATITGADEALMAYGSTVELAAVVVTDSGYGLVVGSGSKVSAKDVKVAGCGVGVIDLGGAKFARGDIVVENSEESDFLEFTPFASVAERGGDLPPKPAAGQRELLGEYTVEGEENWSGTVVISGRVTVPPGSMLRLSPGTRVAFRRFDTNSDGLGEGELLVLGSIRSLGTAEAPVVFESAELAPRAGDWAKVSLISSEDVGNSFDHTVFRHGIQPLHAHFSSFKVSNSLFIDNLRGVQFQESDSAVVVSNRFVGNKQAVRMRDSKVLIEGNFFKGNLFALHGFRCKLTFKNNTIEDTLLGGMLAKETTLEMSGNRFSRNRFALRAKGEGSVVNFTDNTLAGVAETAVSFNETTAELHRNTFDSAGIDLVGISGGKVLLRHNLLGAAQRHAIHLSGPADVDALENTWGGGDPALRIHDVEDRPGLGRVRW
jgi:hypothetical protein